jgi:hypothetical protein
MTIRNDTVYFTGKKFDLFLHSAIFNVLKILIILPIAKDRSKHLWITASINIFLTAGTAVKAQRARHVPGQGPAPSAKGAKKSYTRMYQTIYLS